MSFWSALKAVHPEAKQEQPCSEMFLSRTTSVGLNAAKRQLWRNTSLVPNAAGEL